METPCWSPTLRDSNMAAGNQWKHLELSLPLKTSILSVKLEYIRIGTSLNILVTQNSKTTEKSIFSCT